MRCRSSETSAWKGCVCAAVSDVVMRLPGQSKGKETRDITRGDRGSSGRELSPSRREGDLSVAAKGGEDESGHTAAGLEQLCDLGQGADHRLAGNRRPLGTLLPVLEQHRRLGVAGLDDRA